MKILVIVLLFFSINLVYSELVKSENIIEINVLNKKYYVSFIVDDKKFKFFDELH